MGTLACSSDDPVDSPAEEDARIRAFMDSLGIQAERDDAGFYYYPITLNPGGKSQSEGNILSVFYTLSLLDGDTIIRHDSARGKPLVLKQGENAIYPFGFEQALDLLKEGEEWGFIFPSALAYGELSFSGLIPPNAVLVASVRLDKIQNENDILDEQLKTIQKYVDDKNLRDTVSYPLNQPKFLPQGLNMVYKRLRAGVPGTKPSPGDTVHITYEIKNLAGEQLAVRGAAEAFQLIVDNGDVIPGLNIGVKQMEKGERALLILPAAVAYRYSTAVIPDFDDIRKLLADKDIIPPYATGVRPYEVLLVDLQMINDQ